MREAREMGRREVEMVKIGPRGMLVASFFVAVLALVFLLAVPAKAQDASRDTIDPAGEAARITESTTDDDEIVDRIVVAVGDCRVGSDASVVVEDDDGTRVRLADGGNVTITADADAITIVGTGDGGNLEGIDASGGDRQFGTEGEIVEGEVVSSAGITCGRDAAEDEPDPAEADPDGGEGGDDEDLENLSCDELLVLFRADGNGQYGDASNLADSDVRARIEVCLKKEVVNEPGGKLPKTGGLSLLGLAVLGIVSAAAGLSVIRGGRR